MALNNEVSILNIANIDNDIKDEYTRAMIAGEEKQEYATRNYITNQYFIWYNRKIYKTITDITVGTSFVVDVNIKLVSNIASELYELYTRTPESTRELVSNLELTPNASRAYNAGEYIIRDDGLLYRVTTFLSLGTLWQVDVNIERVENVTTLINELEAGLNATRNMIAPIEFGAKAGKNYNIGDQFVYQGILCRAIKVINMGNTFLLNVNYEYSEDVVSQVSPLKGMMAPIELGPKYSKKRYMNENFIFNGLLYKVSMDIVDTTMAINPGTNCELANSISDTLMDFNNYVTNPITDPRKEITGLFSYFVDGNTTAGTYDPMHDVGAAFIGMIYFYGSSRFFIVGMYISGSRANDNNLYYGRCKDGATITWKSLTGN